MTTTTNLGITPEIQALLTRAQAAANAANNNELLEIGRQVGFDAPTLGIGPYLVGLAQSNLGMNEAARAALQHAVRLEPNQSEFLFQLSFVEMNISQLDHAMDGFLRVIQLNPQKDAAYVNIGAIHARRDERANAMDWFKRAVKINANNFVAWNSMAEITLAAGDFAEAVRLIDMAIAIEPTNWNIYYMKGVAFELTGQIDASFANFEHAHQRNPNVTLPLVRLSKIAAQREQFDDARQWADKANDIAPNDANVMLAMAVAYQRPLPDMPLEVVANIFNSWASVYDQHLTEGLKSHAPALTFEVVKTWLATRGLDDQAIDVLDLGCGTGLFGTLIAKNAKRLIGVDLAQRMLDEAAKRGIYESLHCADLVTFLQNMGDHFDLIAATDVFVYLGDLRHVFEASARVLKSDGTMVFTIETTDTDAPAGYLLEPSGRYQHRLDYVIHAAQIAGFEVKNITESILRQEGGVDVQGAVIQLCQT